LHHLHIGATERTGDRNVIDRPGRVVAGAGAVPAVIVGDRHFHAVNEAQGLGDLRSGDVTLIGRNGDGGQNADTRHKHHQHHQDNDNATGAATGAQLTQLALLVWRGGDDGGNFLLAVVVVERIGIHGQHDPHAGKISRVEQQADRAGAVRTTRAGKDAGQHDQQIRCKEIRQRRQPHLAVQEPVEAYEKSRPVPAGAGLAGIVEALEFVEVISLVLGADHGGVVGVGWHFSGCHGGWRHPVGVIVLFRATGGAEFGTGIDGDPAFCAIHVYLPEKVNRKVVARWHDRKNGAPLLSLAGPIKKTVRAA